MPRKIYEKAIYSRPQQMDRKVYQRANNVLPVTEPTKYQLSAVEVKSAGENYTESFTYIVSGETDGEIAVTVSEGALTAASITTAGVFTSDISGDIEITGGEGGTGGVITITCSEIAE